MGHEFITSVNEGEIILNNVPMRVDGDINYSLENIYGQKIHEGDPGPDDHPINSTITQSRWTGGIGTHKYISGSTQDNAWFSTMDTTIAEALGLPVKVVEYLGSVFSEPISPVYVHDKMAGRMWFSFGKKLKRWNETDDLPEDPAVARSTTGNPIGGGVTWGTSSVAKKLYIPTDSGYEVFDGVNNTVAGTGGEFAIEFKVWEQKLFKLDGSGVVKSTTDGTTWTEKGRIPDESTPRRLVIWKDAGGRHTLHVTTSSSVWALDYPNATLIETDLDYPEHPYQGTAADKWRADLYVSVGIGVHRSVGGQIQAMGPDGRDGLPEQYSSGYFTDFEPGYNELFGILRGTSVSGVAPTETADRYSGPPEGMLATADQAFTMLLGWNGLGWHIKWVGLREPTNIKVGSHSGVYRAFWGSKGALYTRPLPIGYYNPLHSGEQNFPKERFAYHETPYFNWGFDDTPKIMKQFEIKTLQCDDNNYFVVYYRIDDNDEWVELSIIKTNGEHHINIGYGDIADQSFHIGLPHERIQFRFEAFGNPAVENQTPIIRWYTLVGRKWMRMVRTFRFTVDNTTPYKVDVETINRTIFEAVTKKGGSTLVIGNQTYVVDLTSNNVNFTPGKEFTSYPSLVAVEIKEVDAVEEASEAA